MQSLLTTEGVLMAGQRLQSQQGSITLALPAINNQILQQHTEMVLCLEQQLLQQDLQVLDTTNTTLHEEVRPSPRLCHSVQQYK